MDENITALDAREICDGIQLEEFEDIQPYGCLLILDHYLRVLYYSENLPTLLETPLEEFLKQPLSNFLKPQQSDEDLASYLLNENLKYRHMCWKSPKKQFKIWAMVHQDSEHIILELEHAAENDIENSMLFDLAQSIVANMQTSSQHHTIQQVAQSACEEIRKITGYDRVIVYKFSDQNQSGMAIGESVEKNMESYLGLNFPATDVPLPVRNMYLKLSLRYIPSIREKPVKIVSAIRNQKEEINFDLSLTNLRMVAPVHVKYLTNMGVVSSCSVGLIHHKKLLGLIACHHNNPMNLSMNIRFILNLLANVLATQIAELESTKYLHDEQRAAELLRILSTHVGKASSFSLAIDSYHDQLMELVTATGMSIYSQENLLNYGKTPTSEEIMSLISWLKTNQLGITYATSSLSHDFKESLNYKDKCCGLLAIRIIEFENDYLLFYRPELIGTIAWAGNPANSLKREQSSYSPRNSFDRFIETIVEHSSPWTDHEIKSGEFIRSILINRQLQDLLRVQAMHDPLTGLLNRLYLDQRLSLEIQRANRETKPLAIILIDLDYFKRVNDDFGHQAGDLVLKEFATLLKNHFRSYDYIYRYGGEEFLLLLPGVDDMQARNKAESLQTQMKDLTIKFNGKTLPPITISAGISAYPKHGTDALSLIASADTALYHAKAMGRNQIVDAQE